MECETGLLKVAKRTYSQMMLSQSCSKTAFPAWQLFILRLLGSSLQQAALWDICLPHKEQAVTGVFKVAGVRGWKEHSSFFFIYCIHLFGFVDHPVPKYIGLWMI